MDEKLLLTVLQTKHNRSAVIEKTLHSADRCYNISELFNETVVNYRHLRRIKYITTFILLL
jgi:hypothetical protein